MNRRKLRTAAIAAVLMAGVTVQAANTLTSFTVGKKDGTALTSLQQGDTLWYTWNFDAGVSDSIVIEADYGKGWQRWITTEWGTAPSEKQAYDNRLFETAQNMSFRMTSYTGKPAVPTTITAANTVSRTLISGQNAAENANNNTTGAQTLVVGASPVTGWVYSTIPGYTTVDSDYFKFSAVNGKSYKVTIAKVGGLHTESGRSMVIVGGKTVSEKQDPATMVHAYTASADGDIFVKIGNFYDNKNMQEYAWQSFTYTVKVEEVTAASTLTSFTFGDGKTANISAKQGEFITANFDYTGTVPTLITVQHRYKGTQTWSNYTSTGLAPGQKSVQIPLILTAAGTSENQFKLIAKDADGLTTELTAQVSGTDVTVTAADDQYPYASEPNDNSLSTTTTALAGTQVASALHGGDVDWYKIDVQTGKKYTFTFNETTAGARYGGLTSQLFSAAGASITGQAMDKNTDYDPLKDTPASFAYVPTQNGTIYLKMSYLNSWENGRYTLSMSSETAVKMLKSIAIGNGGVIDTAQGHDIEAVWEFGSAERPNQMTIQVSLNGGTNWGDYISTSWGNFSTNSTSAKIPLQIRNVSPYQAVYRAVTVDKSNIKDTFAVASVINAYDREPDSKEPGNDAVSGSLLQLQYGDNHGSLYTTGGIGDVDYLSINVESGKEYTVTADVTTPSTAKANYTPLSITLYNTAKQVVETKQWAAGSALPVFKFTPAASGAYYLGLTFGAKNEYMFCRYKINLTSSAAPKLTIKTPVNGITMKQGDTLALQASAENVPNGTGIGLRLTFDGGKKWIDAGYADGAAVSNWNSFTFARKMPWLPKGTQNVMAALELRDQNWNLITADTLTISDYTYPASAKDVEPNDDIAHAQALPGVPFSGVIGLIDDPNDPYMYMAESDAYSVSVQAGKEYKFTVKNSSKVRGGYFYAELRSADGNSIPGKSVSVNSSIDNYGDSRTDTMKSLIYIPESNGTVYLFLQNASAYDYVFEEHWNRSSTYEADLAVTQPTLAVTIPTANGQTAVQGLKSTTPLSYSLNLSKGAANGSVIYRTEISRDNGASWEKLSFIDQNGYPESYRTIQLDSKGEASGSVLLKTPLFDSTETNVMVRIAAGKEESGQELYFAWDTITANLTCPLTDASEPNDLASQAKQLAVGTVDHKAYTSIHKITDNFDERCDYDFYSINAKQGKMYTVTIKNGSGTDQQLFGELSYKQAEEIDRGSREGSRYGGNTDTSFTVAAAVDKDTVLILKISGTDRFMFEDNYGIAYSITVSEKTPDLSGTLTAPKTAEQGGKLKFSYTLGKDISVHHFEVSYDNGTNWERIAVNDADSTTIVPLYNDEKTGVMYRLMAGANYNTVEKARVTGITLTNAKPDGSEPNNTSGSAKAIAADGTVNHAICSYFTGYGYNAVSDTDMYKFTAEAGKFYTVSIGQTTKNSAFAAGIYNPATQKWDGNNYEPQAWYESGATADLPEITGTGQPVYIGVLVNYRDWGVPGGDRYTIKVSEKNSKNVITFGAPESKTYGDIPFDLTASASSGLAVTYESSNDLIASISGKTVTIHKAGEVTITAKQAGDQPNGIPAAADVSQKLTIAKKTLTISGASANDKVYNGTTDAAVGGTLNGKVNGDAVTLTGSFDSKNVGDRTVEITLAGADAGNYQIAKTTVSAKITPMTLTIKEPSASDKEYDGTKIAYISGKGFVQTLIGEDIVSVSPLSAGIFAQKDVSRDANGNALPISVTANFVLDGADKANYVISQPAGLTAKINPAPLEITADSKTIELGEALPGLTHTIGETYGDNVVVTLKTNADNQTVGDYEIDTVSVTGAENFEVIYSKGKLTVGQIALAVTGLTITKEYDQTIDAVFTGDAVLDKSKVKQGDEVSLKANTLGGYYDDQNVGNSKSVEVYAELEGANADRYKVMFTAVGSITPKVLTLTAPAVNDKPYDGTKTASVKTAAVLDLGGFVGQEDAHVKLSGPVKAEFETKDAGANKKVTVSGYALENVDPDFDYAQNYKLNASAFDLTASISKITLTVSGAKAADKVYDGNSNAEIKDAVLSADKIVKDEEVSLDALTGTFADKNTGPWSVTPALTLKGKDAGNYTLTQPSLAKASITAKPVTAAAGTLAVTSKTYDGTKTAAVTGTPAINDLVIGDNVTLKVVSAEFDSKNAGTNKNVTVVTALEGTDEAKANYSLTANSVTVSNGTITAKPLNTTGAKAADKEYNGTNAAVITASFADLIANDNVTLGGAGTFDNANVGTDKPVTASLSISGTDAGSYSLVQPTGLKAAVTKKPITAVTGAAAASKVYDGTTAGTISGTLTSADIINGDEVTFTAGTIVFDNPNAGTTKTVTVPVTGISGAASGNYDLKVSSVSVTASITPKPVTVVVGTLAVTPKTYDGTKTAAVTGAVSTSDIINSEVTVSLGSVEFADKNVGTDKPVTAVVSLTGDDAKKANYTLQTTSIALKGTVTAKALNTTGAKANDKVYDGTAAAVISASLADLIKDDNVTLGGAGTFDNANAGTGKAVTAALTISGTDAGNYSLVQPAGLTAAVTQKPVTVTAVSLAKDSGAADPVFTVTYSGFITGENESVVTGLAISREAGELPGDYKITPAGASAANYSFVYEAGTLKIKAATAISDMGEVNAGNLSAGIYALNNPVSAESSEAEFIVVTKGSAEIRVVILDPLGNMLDEQQFTAVTAGEPHKFSWNLRDLSGTPVGTGSYLAAALVKESDGTVKRYKTMIGVQR